MKKKLFTTAMIVLVGLSTANAQSMAKGKNVLYFGVGAGSGYIGSNVLLHGSGYTYNRTPTFNLGFEHGISEAIPQSIIGIGANVSSWFAKNTYRDAAGHGWDKNWSDFTFLAKGYYHHKFLVKDKWDVYGTAMIGLKFRNYNFSDNDPYYDYARDSYSTVAPAIGAGIGARYYLGKTFGFYGELAAGYNVSFAQIGIALKF